MAFDRQPLFGADLALRDGVGGADLAFDSATGDAGNMALARGNHNIVQALTQRLRVRQGELAALGWPGYGSRLHELIGQPDLPRTRLKAQVFARDAVQADPRVARIEAVDALRLPGDRQVLRLSLTVRLIDALQPLNMVFDLRLDGSPTGASMRRLASGREVA